MSEPVAVQALTGDVVLVRGLGAASSPYLAQVTGSRLGRLVVERADGRPSGPVAARDVLCVYKSAGPPTGSALAPTERRRPTAQLKLEL